MESNLTAQVNPAKEPWFEENCPLGTDSATSTREMSGEQSSQGTPSQRLRARIPIVPPFLNAPNMKKGLTQFKAHVDSCHADLKREQRGNA